MPIQLKMDDRTDERKYKKQLIKASRYATSLPLYNYDCIFRKTIDDRF